MNLKADANLGEFVDLQVGYLKYHGPIDLQQYFVRSSKMTKINQESIKEEGSIDVEIVLGRRLLGNFKNFVHENTLTFFWRNNFNSLHSYSFADLYFLYHHLFQTLLLWGYSCCEFDLYAGNLYLSKEFSISEIFKRFWQPCLFLWLKTYQKLHT